ncbi:pantoate--beta-alanine ligase [Enterovirga aerilata]|uniref:Pantothenate synthetase n=1 Tax=Enterovirga aerilata TaxID=2730920 RepID=A0A849I661_9HYPH|nr:pantoate--beta-alanine ligase [Enterovirga sp. DB1703]NNM71527.1 pantoate--beta-alanine ligase [Enterovirga sp. DB1703]
MQPPDTVRTVAELRARVAAWRAAGERIALVPTMGALHEGHLALVRAGRERAERAVVSIFVNPKQFAPTEDFDAYPRVAEKDRAALAGLADLVFAPGVNDMYPPGFATEVTVAGPSGGFEGAARPGHFAGVATVVAKLLIQCAPDCAMFGEKDWQQLQVVTRMARDLDLPVEIVPHPTVRDEAGLALSSRNAYLSPEQLAIARKLNVVLSRVAGELRVRPVAEVLAEGRAELERLGFGPIDYLAVAEPESLTPLDVLAPGRPARLLAAARLGPVRLLDNMAV